MSEMDSITRKLLGDPSLNSARRFNEFDMQTTARPDRGAMLRSGAQGLTLGAGDEIEAFVRARFGENYDEALTKIRGELDTLKKEFPSAAITSELSGAAIPAIASLFTGTSGPAAGRFAPYLKSAIFGAGESGLYAFNTGEGVDDRLGRVPVGLVGGGLAGGLGYGAVRAGSGAASKAVEWARVKLGDKAASRVTNEIKRIAEAGGMTVDEVVDGIRNGALPIENKTLMAAARAVSDKSPAARGIFQSVMDPTKGDRPGVLRRETLKYIQDQLTDGVDGNVMKHVNMTDDMRRAAESSEYNRIFAQAGDISDDLKDAMLDAVNRVPGARKNLEAMYRAQTGKTPFFKITDEGIEFTTPPTLEDAEILYRSIRDQSGTLSRSGASVTSGAVGDVAKGLKSTIDGESAALASVRARWKGIEDAAEAFQEGRKFKSADEVEIGLDEAMKKGEAVFKAYKAGLADAIRRKGASGQGPSLPGMIANPERKEGQIVRFALDNPDDAVGMATRADNSLQARNTILGNSITGTSIGHQNAMNTGLLEDGIAATGGSFDAVLRLTKQAIKALKPDLSQKELAKVAEMLVSDNPQQFLQAYSGGATGTAIQSIVQDGLMRLANPVSQAARRGILPFGEYILTGNQ